MEVQVRSQMHMHGGGPAQTTSTSEEFTTMNNGVRASDLTGVSWRKSGRSGAGNCVELAELSRGGAVAVRNSRFPDGPALVYTRSEIEALILGVKDGDFDDLLL